MPKLNEVPSWVIGLALVIIGCVASTFMEPSLSWTIIGVGLFLVLFSFGE